VNGWKESDLFLGGVVVMNDSPGVEMDELVDISDVNESTLKYWKKQGLFSPTEETKDNHKKAGYKYDLQAVQCVLTVKKLRDQGVSLQKIREAVDVLREYGENLSGVVLYTDNEGDELYRIEEKEDLMESLTSDPGQLEDLQLVSLDDVNEEARKAMEKVA
jgi:DNA-binding transcriptional MerR regulator